MFFWTLLAALLGIVMFGHWRDNSKDQEQFVAPVYQAMALSTYQQHLAAEQAYLTTMAIPSNVNPANENSVAKKLENVPVVDMMAEDSPFGNIKSGTDSPFTPKEYKFQDTAKTYLFCLNRGMDDPFGSPVSPQELTGCFDPMVSSTVKYLVTIRPVPAKYQGAGKMSVLRSIAEATNGSRSVGLLMKYKDEGLKSEDFPEVHYQPLGARYYILSGGASEAGNVFIPNSVVCNFPLNNTTALKDKLDQSDYNYIVALSMLGGFGELDNLPEAGWCESGDEGEGD